ncbi:MAG: guanylate kinase [Terrisporobacter othiniensis]|uniref:Guanylate kinase n=1 Tax=Terrisporobacter petrolearius TaxID=1460447 RepID=A0ABZ3F849_9FIRM|nr:MULTISPECIES: guanylate kinase [Terrisporobacter]MDU4861356.1 guanylate kinase [Terrisporobacter othiniensis]MDU6994990.1 guanylate kinase [Terrisporobacter othiniensis]UPA30560.1 guanylate kinase [Terrisporobacter glycolicus]
MGKIFCLMGKSSSGKDTIFKEINDDKDLDLKPIISYTTRPKRINETNGVEYFFINTDELNKFEKENKVIEKRVYHTVHGDWFYGTINDGQIDLNKNNYLLITTLEAYKSLRDYFGDDKVYPFYIDIEDGIRLERALERERKQDKPNYDELCRRFLADNKDFSAENLSRLGINKFYINENLENCINDIKKDILNLMQ